MTRVRRFLRCLPILLAFQSAHAEIPRLLHHQGRMAVNGVPFDGPGQFKFAFVDGDGATSYWSNDCSSIAGSEPAASVTLPVTRGLYAVLLGDMAVPDMAAVPATVFDHADVRLRVWFDDSAHGFQRITPDQRFAAAPYALSADHVERVLLEEIKAPPVFPVVAWGKNSVGQTAVPVTLTGSNVTAISAKGNTSLALLKNGTVIQWGSGPPVPALSGITAISAGVDHAIALRGDGTLAAWGDDTYGQSDVAGITGVRAIAAGEKHSVLLHADGIVSAIGDNTFLQTDVPALANITAIAAGYDHSLALAADGNVTAWGRDDAGQTDVPAGLTDVVAIAAGAYHSLALKRDGTVVAWGWDAAGQSSVPADLTGVSAIAAGYGFSIALKNDGTLAAWGDATGGPLAIPAEAALLVSIAAGDSHVLALHTDLIPAQVARLDQTNVFTGKIGVRRAPATNALEVEGNASKSSAGSWLSNSDRRIKTNIRTVTGALDKIDRVRLVDFQYTGDYLGKHPGLGDRRYLNVIAQEFAKIFPDDVKGSGEFLADGSEILQVDTYPLTICSAAAIQELHRENRELKERLAEQEERLRRLEQALAK